MLGIKGEKEVVCGLAHRAVLALAVNFRDAAKLVAGHGHAFLPGFCETLCEMPGHRLCRELAVLFILFFFLEIGEFYVAAGELADRHDRIRHRLRELVEHHEIRLDGFFILRLVVEHACVGELFGGYVASLLFRDLDFDFLDAELGFQRLLYFLGMDKSVRRPRRAGILRINVDELLERLGKQVGGILFVLESRLRIFDYSFRLVVHHYAHKKTHLGDRAQARQVVARLLAELLKLVLDAAQLRHIVVYQLVGALDIALYDLNVSHEHKRAPEPQILVPQQRFGARLGLGEQRVAILSRFHVFRQTHRQLCGLERGLALCVLIEPRDGKQIVVRFQRVLVLAKVQQHLRVLIERSGVESLYVRRDRVLVFGEEAGIYLLRFNVLAKSVVIVRKSEGHRPDVRRFLIRLSRDHALRLVEFALPQKLLKLGHRHKRFQLRELRLEVLDHELGVVWHVRVLELLDILKLHAGIRRNRDLAENKRGRRRRDDDRGYYSAAYLF